MPTELNTLRIRTIGGKDVSTEGTMIQLRLGSAPGHVNITIKFPGASKWSNLGDLAVVDGIATLPVSMVFIAYAKEDKQEVRRLADRLWNDAFLVWMDERDLLPGDNWQGQIDDAIERCDFVLIVLSGRSCDKTGQVQREIKHAFRQRDLRPGGKRFIIPVLLDECNPPREFHDIHWVKLSETDAYERLCCAMR